MNIFLQKNKGIKFEGKSLRNDDLKKIKVYENIIIENLSPDVDEKLLYSLLNLIEQDNKFIIVTSTKPIVSITFDLKDLKSRTKNFILLNIIDQDNKYLIITSKEPIVDIKFSLVDLKSRTKNFILQKIERPDDDLLYALIIKNLSDRQISMEKNLINYIIKRIDRSYRKIFDFIYKIDEMSLKKKKSINLKIIKEVLGD